jgi:hypothetical protein
MRVLRLIPVLHPDRKRGLRGFLGRAATWLRRQEYGVGAAALQLSVLIHTVWLHNFHVRWFIEKAKVGFMSRRVSYRESSQTG